MVVIKEPQDQDPVMASVMSSVISRTEPLLNLCNVIKRKMDGYKLSNKAEMIDFFCASICIKSPIEQQGERLVEWLLFCPDIFQVCKLSVFFINLQSFLIYSLSFLQSSVCVCVF